MRAPTGLVLATVVSWGACSPTPDTATVANAGAGPAKAGGFAWLEVRGVAYVNQGGSRHAEVKMDLVGELAGPVLKVSHGTLIAATTDTGAALLSHELDRDIGFPWLGEDGKIVRFDVTLELPPPGAKGYKEISGTLACVTGRPKDVDLGIPELKADAKGKQ